MFKSSNLIKLVVDEEEYISSIRAKLGETTIERVLNGVSKLTPVSLLSLCEIQDLRSSPLNFSIKA
jgi:hypothetical protein